MQCGLYVCVCDQWLVYPNNRSILGVSCEYYVVLLLLLCWRLAIGWRVRSEMRDASE